MEVVAAVTGFRVALGWDEEATSAGDVTSCREMPPEAFVSTALKSSSAVEVLWIFCLMLAMPTEKRELSCLIIGIGGRAGVLRSTSRERASLRLRCTGRWLGGPCGRGRVA